MLIIQTEHQKNLREQISQLDKSDEEKVKKGTHKWVRLDNQTIVLRRCIRKWVRLDNQ